MRLQLRERDDLRDAIAPVLLGDVGEDALAALHREVDVDVGHRLAARVQEALEQQVVRDRIEVGDLQAVRDERAGRRSAPRADGDAVLLGEPHEVPDDQEVVGEAHLADRLELELEPRPDRVVDVRVAAGEPLLAEAAEHAEAVALGLVEAREPQRSELELDVAALGDLDRRREQVVAPARHQRLHLGRGLEVELVRLETEPVLVGEERVRLDAEERVVRPGVLGVQVVHVAGADDREAGVGGDPQEPRVDLGVLGHAGVLQLDVDVVASEDRHEPVELGARRGLVAASQRLAGDAGHAPRQADQPVGVALEQLVVDARLVVVALEESERAQLDEVVVAGRRLGEQRQVAPGPLALVPVALAPVGDDVHLAAEQRLDPDLARSLVELDRPGHRAVIGEPHGGHAEIGGALHELGDPTGAVEHRVLGVDVKVNVGGVGHGQASVVS